MKLSNWRRISSDDFDPSNEKLIEGLSTPINSAMDELYEALDNRLDFVSNINATLQSFNISVDSSGVPFPAVQFKMKDTQTVLEGLIVLDVSGTKDTSLEPTGGLFIKAVQNGQNVVIKKVKGLQAGALYTVKVLAI